MANWLYIYSAFKKLPEYPLQIYIYKKKGEQSASVGNSTLSYKSLI